MPPANRPIDSSFCAWRSWLSAVLRAVMSTTVAKTWMPSAVLTGERLISTGNSVPSLRRPARSSPMPTGRATGWAMKSIPLCDVALDHAIGQEHLDGLTEQLVALVAERGHGLRVRRT